ncbi:hypothetical protein FSARC_12554, partial [Fusarium sarcochroum]
MSNRNLPPTKTDAITIVGAGIFGLSTAIHLAQRGYKSVTVFDRQPYEKTLYSYTKGCDAASADINKIIRSAYGSQKVYQDLSLEAIESWKSWSEELLHDDAAIPPGMTARDSLWINNGDLSCTDENVLPPFERATIESMEHSGFPDTQLVNNNTHHLDLAEKKGLTPHMQPFAKKLLGVLDTTGGVTLADKACRFAMHKAKRSGVQFVLGQTAGKVISIIQGSDGRVLGISTADGKTHHAALTIVACGGWTPSLIPELDGFAETTAGSVVIFKLPKDLRERFSPSRFPAW